MSLTDIMSSSGLVAFAEIALVLFIAAFVMVLVAIVCSNAPDLERTAGLPLADDQSPTIIPGVRP